MADEKPLTKSDLVASLEEAGLATKANVQQTVQEASDAILAGVDKILEEIDARFRSMESRAAGNHLELKRQIDDLKYDTPSRREFDELKEKVERLRLTL